MTKTLNNNVFYSFMAYNGSFDTIFTLFSGILSVHEKKLPPAFEGTIKNHQFFHFFFENVIFTHNT